MMNEFHSARFAVIHHSTFSIQETIMNPKPPQDLRQRTKTYALRIIRLYSSLPKATETQIIGKQMLRSGTSVGAHYREADRGKSTPDFITKYGGRPARTGRNSLL